MECKFLGIDIQDNQGRHEVGYMENTVRGELIRNHMTFAAQNLSCCKQPIWIIR